MNYHCIQSAFFGNFNDGFFGFFPVFVGANIFFLIVRIAKRNLGNEILEIKALKICITISITPLNSSFTWSGVQKIWASSWVNPLTLVKSMQFAALLITVNRSEFSKPDGQFFV